MNNKKLRILTRAALLAAFTCTATILIRIPTPTKGYVNLGDCLVNVSAWLLGPFYGSAAAGIGSALADVTSGYIVYAPATLIIKGLMAAASFGVFAALSKKLRSSVVSRIIAAASAEVIMVVGYAAFEAVMYGSIATAILGVGANIAQGIMGIVSSVVIYEAVIKKLPRSI